MGVCYWIFKNNLSRHSIERGNIAQFTLQGKYYPHAKIRQQPFDKGKLKATLLITTNAEIPNISKSSIAAYNISQNHD